MMNYILIDIHIWTQYFREIDSSLEYNIYREYVSIQCPY